MPHTFKPPAKIDDLYAATDGNNFAAINAPTSGAREASGPGPTLGAEALQRYSRATPTSVLKDGAAPHLAHIVCPALLYFQIKSAPGIF